MGLTFALVAGEESGDILGYDLIRALKQHFPNAHFEGIGGERMKSLGFHSLFPLERLSVMGLIEPLKRLPEILAMRSALKRRFLQTKPCIYIGIDSPDFNLSLAKTLKSNGIKTAHYVSPTVWAWRKRRIKTIKKAIDLMLVLFPFEQKIYEDNHIPVCFVGHPLADVIPLTSDKLQARQELNLPAAGKVVALLPGSREQELNFLAEPFIQTANWLKEQDHNLMFITACPNLAREQQFKAAIRQHKGPLIHFYQQKAQEVMTASDAILVASGTATLQAMLVKRPTVIAYKMSSWVFAIAKRLIKIPYIGLPNLLAKACIMPEFVQTQVQPHDMGKQLQAYLNEPELQKQNLITFLKIHKALKKDAGARAAQAITKLL
ncbi:MAG: lipid-A-disaccharide synthase [Proteobacteria bacterium]|nr:lipid-A-disaccharide synthase [Pseudomonadota bacterium]